MRDFSVPVVIVLTAMGCGEQRALDDTGESNKTTPLNSIGGSASGGDGSAAQTAVDAATSNPDASGGTYVPATCVPLSDNATLARFQAGMIGTWSGTATTPAGWTWSQATVEFTFFCDGHYQGRCLAADAECVALYYGTDADAPQKTYELDDLHLDGSASGNIVVYFPEGTTTDDQLLDVALDATAGNLSFDLWHLFEYGPVHYQLQRTD
jgi:hypothetical protein